FWDRLNTETKIIGAKFNSRILGDAGVGIRVNTTLFEKELFLRIDLPFFIMPDETIGNSYINWENWVFSFQRSL
ncbi:MAG: hypothetical protein HOF42_07130, partial [Candidatus Marinimicrobia bacterium]|nr:hypothetical protein [Candidatus Neomarinimicrobiota bacterium]